ncbi:MAG: hypothetical protein K9J27_05730 [Bacteroidales bacterium]|nr:hypothetical protein [Bacteroidales bacterium]
MVKWAQKFHLKRGVATQKIEALFYEAGDLLNMRLDNLMKVFVKRNPNFFCGHLHAWVIADY